MHIGGFTPFALRNHQAGAGQRTIHLVVRVNNNRHAEGLCPPWATDWWNYGGLTRDVLLVDAGDVHFNFLVRLKLGTTNTIEARVELDGPDKEQSVKISRPG